MANNDDDAWEKFWNDIGLPAPDMDDAETVVEVQRKGVWVRIAGVSSEILASAMVEKLESRGHKVRTRRVRLHPQEF